MTLAYGICFIISILVIIYMAQRNYENVNIQQWAIVVMFPFVLGAYYLLTLVNEPEAAYVLMCFIYVDSTVLITAYLFSILRLLKVEAKPWGKTLAYGAAFAHILLVVFCFHTKLYYKEIILTPLAGGNGITTIDGPVKFLHIIYLGLAFAAIIALLILGYIKKGTYSFRLLTAYTLIVIVALMLYAVEIIFGLKNSYLPFLYAFADIVIATGYNYGRAHELSSVVSKQRSEDETNGYMILGLNRRYLGCNERCIDFIPDLAKQRVDELLPKDSELRGGIDHFIDAFEKGERNSARFNVGDRIWICNISHFSARKDGKKQGYLFELRDATEEEKMYHIVTEYNETLNAEVKAKTEEIKEIQNKIVLGMANMIENRDSNTGGHVKRTSEVVKILIEEINKEGKIFIDEELAVDIIRSAPMHDLGKMQVDSSILCKPGRLTDEEFAIMKTHAEKSGEMVHILLEGVEEERFVEVAYNVARYHHERWDGSGYPTGLKGEEIPIGARIMAVADVYDALVSKRCYKESLSFEKATEIMLDGMGKMFDPDMQEVFLGCKDKLEAYYSE